MCLPRKTRDKEELSSGTEGRQFSVLNSKGLTPDSKLQ